MVKLFAMYAPPPDIEASLAAYLEETRDIPWLFVSHALRRIVDRPVSERGNLVARRFLPSISEIRHEAARVIRMAKLKGDGKDPHEYALRGDFELNTERWIREAPELIVRVEQHAAQLEGSGIYTGALAAGEPV